MNKKTILGLTIGIMSGFIFMQVIQNIDGFGTIFKYWAFQNTEQPDYYILEQLDNESMAEYKNRFALNPDNFTK